MTTFDLAMNLELTATRTHAHTHTHTQHTQTAILSSPMRSQATS